MGLKKAIYIKGKDFYFRLIPDSKKKSLALLDVHSFEDCLSQLLVCFVTDKIGSWKLKSESKLFALFDSYVQFAQFLTRFPLHERSFFEVIFGARKQKPHFDIDIKDEKRSLNGKQLDDLAEKVKDELIWACIGVLEEKGVKLNLEKDLLLYSSHGIEKRSFHLVLANWYHDGNMEAKAFYEAVGKKMNPLLAQFVDHAVYSRKQQFRIWGCQKKGTGRIKKFHETFLYQGESITHIYPETTEIVERKFLIMLYESLVTFTSGCSILPYFVSVERREWVYDKQEDLPEDIAMYAMELLAKHEDEELDGDFPYSIIKVEGNAIFLKRLRGTPCSLCKGKVHEHENPFIMVWDNRIYWSCRRVPSYKPPEKRRLLLGYVPTRYLLKEGIHKQVSEEEEEKDEDGGFFSFGYEVETNNEKQLVNVLQESNNLASLSRKSKEKKENFLSIQELDLPF